jgi:hypothetical protein
LGGVCSSVQDRVCCSYSCICGPGHFRIRNRSLPRMKCQPRGPLRMPWHLTSSNLVLGGAVKRTAGCTRGEASRGLMRGRESVRHRTLAVTSTEPICVRWAVISVWDWRGNCGSWPSG